jgi:hypothetical protein
MAKPFLRPSRAVAPTPGQRLPARNPAGGAKLSRKACRWETRLGPKWRFCRPPLGCPIPDLRHNSLWLRGMKHEGGCHCGAIRILFETGGPLSPRACQCTFCRRHGARSVSDPDGAATLTLSGEPIRYRFGAHAADYLICPRCGIYVGATAELDGRAFVTLNLNAFDDPRLDLEADPVSYDGESVETKAGRRRARWTPLAIVRA